MSSIFNYARNKIEKEYSANHYFFNAKEIKQYKLDYITFCEIKSKGSVKKAIAYRCKAFWSVQDSDEKVGIFCGFAVFAFMLLVSLYGIKYTPSNLLITNFTKSFLAVLL